MMPLPTEMRGEMLARTQQYGTSAAPREARTSLRLALARVRLALEPSGAK